MDDFLLTSLMSLKIDDFPEQPTKELSHECHTAIVQNKTKIPNEESITY